MITTIHPEQRLVQFHEQNERLRRLSEHRRAHRVAKRKDRRRTTARRTGPARQPAVVAIGGAR